MKARGLALAFAAACVSGVAVFVNSYGVKRFADATVYTTAKNAVAATLLLAALGAGARRAPSARPGRTLPRRTWIGLVALGVIGGSVPFVLFFEGLARASSVQAAFIHKTLVVWVALLAIPLLRERIGALHVAAIGLLVWGQASLTKDLGGLRFGSGEAMILGATLLWAAEFVLAKRLLGSVRPATVAAARMGIGLAFLLAYVIATGRANDLASLSATQWGWALATGGILGAFVWCWYSALARVQASDAAAVLVAGAVVTAALASGVQHAPFAPNARGIALLALGAAAIAAAMSRERPLAEVTSP
jgi:drug/metabolite transporter (DMT)-like permease